ncbi:hypothetical protein [Enterococcus sp. DIV0660C]|nr:hypothetical protein [Enterococcus sp. DIV0660C]MBO0432753.1 hypothetical protein [Enterococcus sp. DIV0660C]
MTVWFVVIQAKVHVFLTISLYEENYSKKLVISGWKKLPNLVGEKV